jgi:hypothetical protein
MQSDGDSEDSTGVLVAKAAAAMLGDLKIGDSARLAAFAKRLCTSALHCNTGMALAMLSIANRCVMVHLCHCILSSGLRSSNLQRLRSTTR